MKYDVKKCFKILAKAATTTTDLDEENELRNWAIDHNINNAAIDDLLKILKRKSLPHLPLSAKTFLGVKYNYEIKSVTNEDGEVIYEHAYFGLEENLKRTINPLLHEDGKIQLHINVDGMSVYKSNNIQFWPILAKVHSDIDVYEPFVVGILVSDGKPHNPKKFLKEFVRDINRLHKSGLQLNEKELRVSIKCFICDTPARCFLKYTKGHGGYGACERCDDPGIRLEGRLTYPDCNSKERKDESFRARVDSEHHTGFSPLLKIKPKINMITMFILDYMHLACNGVMLKLLWEFWINGKRQFKLGEKAVKEMSRRLAHLKKYIPLEFQRKIRTVKCANKWKATELRFFLLYCGPLILKYLIRTILYKHFLLLHAAFRILCSDLFRIKAWLAKIYLRKFVKAMSILYGPQTIIMNIHNLLHVADDAVNMGCNLSKISAFPFENCLGKMRKSVRTPNKPLPQACRRIEEKQNFQNRVPAIPDEVTIVSSKCTKDYVLIQKLKIKNLFTITTKRPDNCIITNEGHILFVTKIFYKKNYSNDVHVTGIFLKKFKDVFNYPVKSRKIGIWQICKTDKELTIPVNSIKNKLVFLSLNFSPGKHDKHFVIPFLH